MISETYNPRLLIIYGIVILSVIRISFLLINKKHSKVLNLKREFLFDLFIIYILCVISITLLPITIYYVDAPFKIVPNVNFIPFNGVAELDKITLENILGNLFLLTPFVIFLKLLYSNKFNNFKKSILPVLMFSIFIEAAQYFEMLFQLNASRVTDITDVILNSLSGFIGYYIYCKFFENVNKNIEFPN
ncbi:VanZ family protein [Clostridium botulinum]|uniref:VanZ family protein n=1 Tax=Clostridium botulinum TaxID=1491 RepID=UPI00077316AC|nr:VanZ family protein [Clostridium botulinum]NFH80229.1 VanZ family protein [Clostridium botulinum]NFH81878.1 VanZ family protein [Clostridium botulinum]NFI09852.1 VanZ family protein [Clostridium botulinum]NFI14911.1 VanZ family protein [Clostridium botulinum]NFO84994.1 VanZ family protein [Clostridium botulinum]